MPVALSILKTRAVHTRSTGIEVVVALKGDEERSARVRSLVQSSLETTVRESGRVDKYRLSEGRLEFQPSGTRQWRTLDYPEVQHHLALNTPVAKWLGYLTSVGDLARFLCSSAQQ